MEVEIPAISETQELVQTNMILEHCKKQVNEANLIVDKPIDDTQTLNPIQTHTSPPPQHIEVNVIVLNSTDEIQTENSVQTNQNVESYSDLIQDLESEVLSGQQSPDTRNKETLAETYSRVCSEYNTESEWTHEETELFEILPTDFFRQPDCKISRFDKEIEVFSGFIDESMMDKICEETNRYAAQERTVTKKGVATKVITKNWTELTKHELKAFIGTLILMGIHELPRLENYWSSDPVLGLPAIAKAFTKPDLKKSWKIFI